MGVVEGYQLNNSKAPKTLLIATQDSPYKNKVTRLIAEGIGDLDFFVKVVDVTQLDCGQHGGFNAYIFLHTWEMNKPPSQLSTFYSSCNVRDSSFYICTSGDGGHRLEGVDGISSASIILNAEKDAESALVWLRKQLFEPSSTEVN